MAQPPTRATPSLTACMIPWRPPQTTKKPQSPRSSPTRNAVRICAPVASRGPITPIGTRNGWPLSRMSQVAAAIASTTSQRSLFSAERTKVHVRVTASKRCPAAS